MKLRIFLSLLMLAGLTTLSFGQIEEQPLNDSITPIPNPVELKRSHSLTGFGSFGQKNTYGAWGVFIGESFNISKLNFEATAGIGINNSLVSGASLGVRIYNSHRKTEFFLNGGYCHHNSGIIRFDYDDRKNNAIYSDQYRFGGLNYIQAFLTSRYFFGRANEGAVALQLKTGYSFAQHKSGFEHITGPYTNTGKVNRMLNDGIMIAADLVIYIRYFEDFKKKPEQKN